MPLILLSTIYINIKQSKLNVNTLWKHLLSLICFFILCTMPQIVHDYPKVLYKNNLNNFNSYDHHIFYDPRFDMITICSHLATMPVNMVKLFL